MKTAPHELTVLIVEDDPAALKALDIILTKKYPDTVYYFAIDGKTALEYFKEYLPDIVITDVIMPGMNGCQLAREIKAIRAETKLIILTGLSDMSDVSETSLAGITIDHRVSKPRFSKSACGN